MLHKSSIVYKKKESREIVNKTKDATTNAVFACLGGDGRWNNIAKYEFLMKYSKIFSPSLNAARCLKENFQRDQKEENNLPAQEIRVKETFSRLFVNYLSIEMKQIFLLNKLVKNSNNWVTEIF